MTIPRAVSRAALLVAVAALAAGDLVGFLSGAEHHGGFWNSVPLADFAVGALGTLGLVWFARGILKPLLARPETYYEEGP